MSAEDSSVLNQILTQLGAIVANQETLTREFVTERDHARTSRAALHDKVDDLANRVAKTEASIEEASHVAEQTKEKIKSVRDEIVERVDSIDAKLSTDISPPVEDFKRMRAIGLGIVGIIAMGGTAFGASLLWWGEQTASLIRHILRINP